ncbi:putative nuclease HARBI1 [Palaemon carinicauda]|uniref:putative nuclease HARBI1 n=1 Tax=Palaemon carinicauda TaxID=392227 RepID=UPI0035B57F0E
MYGEVGAIWSESDGGVFAQTQLAGLLDRNEVQLPKLKMLSKNPTGPPTEYFFIGDDAFLIRTYLMKRYPNRAHTREERIYNYRLSRARLTVENTFGILANHFRVFHTSICLKPDHIEPVIMAACILHNILRRQVLGHQEGDYKDPVTHEMAYQ